jgi:hypothetical protein
VVAALMSGTGGNLSFRLFGAVPAMIVEPLFWNSGKPLGLAMLVNIYRDSFLDG